MPLYEMTPDTFRPLGSASLADLKVSERYDLQRLLRTQIEVLDDDLYVLTEEFGDWEDSRRRIDLLAIDQQANLVVIELKRTNSGGHMELQALRYASMVSAMTFERAEQIHAEFLSRMGESPDEAQSRMLEFLEWSEPDEASFAADVRILLVSQDFGKELTTTVLWLRERDIDIRCIRLCPYKDGDGRLIDVQQIIPLPEANEYQVQLKKKEQTGRKARIERHDLLLHFWQGVVAIARKRNTRHANIKPGPYRRLRASAGMRGLRFNYALTQEKGVVELHINRRDMKGNKGIFDQLHSKKKEIENKFGGNLTWEPPTTKGGWAIRHVIDIGGYGSPETQWPEIQFAMVEAMDRLEEALEPSIISLK